MFTDENETLYGEYMGELFENNIKEFKYECPRCLRSYYLDNKLLAEPTIIALAEAKKLVKLSPTAGFIFAAIAMEVGPKDILLRPSVLRFTESEFPPFLRIVELD